MNKHSHIPLSPVVSSQVSGIGYDAGTKTLAVSFNSGSTYHYHDVPVEKFEAIAKAESVGQYLGKHIKPFHPFQKLNQT